MTLAAALLVDEIRKHPDGRVDLIGLFEDIQFPDLPVTLESLQIFVDFELDRTDGGQRKTISLEVIQPDGQPLQAPTIIRFQIPESPPASAQLDLALFELTFRQYGPHAIALKIDEATVRRLPLNLLPTHA